MSHKELHPFSLDRMVRAVAKVRERLLRAVRALDAAGIPYAVSGGNAVAAWVARVDEAAVRFTPDIDILVRRSDFSALATAFEGAGLRHRNVAGHDIFLDRPDGRERDAIHLVYTGERLSLDLRYCASDLSDVDDSGTFRVVSLDALVRMKLTSHRLEDRVHLRDMLDVGLIDESWLTRLPADLAARLKILIDTPDG